MPEVKPKSKPMNDEEQVKILISKLEGLTKEKMKKLNACTERRNELQKNGDIVLTCLKYGDLILRTEIDCSETALALVMAMFTSAEEKGLIKINDNFGKK